MAFISKAKVKTILLNQLEILGYTRLADSIIGSDGSTIIEHFENLSANNWLVLDRFTISPGPPASEGGNGA